MQAVLNRVLPSTLAIAVSFAACSSDASRFVGETSVGFAFTADGVRLPMTEVAGLSPATHPHRLEVEISIQLDCDGCDPKMQVVGELALDMMSASRPREFDVQGKTATFTLDVEQEAPLERGGHCLLATVSRSSADLVDTRIRSGVFAAAIRFTVGEGGEDHCWPELADGQIVAADVPGCGGFVSTDPEHWRVRSRERAPSAIYLGVPECPGRAASVMLLDGAIVFDGGLRPRAWQRASGAEVVFDVRAGVLQSVAIYEGANGQLEVGFFGSRVIVLDRVASPHP